MQLSKVKLHFLVLANYSIIKFIQLTQGKKNRKEDIAC